PESGAADDTVATRDFRSAAGQKVMPCHGGERAGQGLRPGIVVGQHPHHHRVVVEGAAQHPGQVADVGLLCGPNADAHPPWVMYVCICSRSDFNSSMRVFTTSPMLTIPAS